MPWYRVGGLMMHMRVDKRALKKMSPPCPFFLKTKADERVRCMQMAPYLCDWPGCDVPICGDHALHLGPELDVCPTHNHQRGLLSRLLPMPEGANR